MRLRTLGAALAAGVASVLVVGIAVTELLAPRIEFSLLVGIPAGLVAGAFVAAFVAYGLGRRGDPTVRALASGLAAFGVVLLAVAAVANAFLSVGLVASLVAAGVAGAAVGVATGIGVLRRARRGGADGGEHGNRGAR